MVRMQSSLAVTERQEYRRDKSHVHQGRRRPVTHTFSDWERFSFPVKWSGQGGIAERIGMKICMEWSCDGHFWLLTLLEKGTMTSLVELWHTCVPHLESLQCLTGVGGRVKRAASLREARFICLHTFCSGAEGLQDWVLSIRNTFKAGWEGFWSEWAACVLLH